MSKTLRYVLVLLALAGIGVGIYLTLIKVWLLTDPSYHSVCSVSEAIDCDKVNSSPYSQVWGIPLGLYGVAFYAVILCLSLMSLTSREKWARAPELVFGLSTLSVLLSGVLAYLSAAKVGAWCLFCISLYVINLLLTIVSYAAAGGGLRAVLGRLDAELSSFYRSPLVYVTALVFFGVILLGGGAYAQQIQAAKDRAIAQLAVDVAKGKKEAPELGATAAPGGSEASQPKPDEHPAESLLDDPIDLPLYGYEPIRGNPKSPVLIYAWSDFECPHCQIAAGALDELVAKMPGQVAEVYKQYPLDMDCNQYIQRPMHENACRASIAAMCAQRQGLFWEMHDQFFRNQQRLSAEDIKGYAKTAGVDMAQFEACLNDRSIIVDLNRDIEQGKAAGVNGTPSLYFNGRRWKGPPIPEVMARAVQEMIAQGAGQPSGANGAQTGSGGGVRQDAGAERAAARSP